MLDLTTGSAHKNGWREDRKLKSYKGYSITRMKNEFGYCSYCACNKDGTDRFVSLYLDELKRKINHPHVNYKRCTAVAGPNSHSWWVYDGEGDFYIQITLDVENELDDIEDWDEKRHRLEEIIKSDPDWLQDKDWWFYHIEI